ncbi:hypothetical protein BS50DRAFT_597695 [Corynespora cassiicola Philippines]|uniref:Alcohol dehydrogenase-like N-terminal domain-containing protein n=1 Tax=Corynespora cassiicola Philippines TaxID=1448308 RepID=A0A2T2P3X7_CORCC|nr:hypothetical protein BS50DRAFT_597695 [Corynespora cassiicola Philippines]
MLGNLVLRQLAFSINPIDTRVHAGTYDDYLDFFSRAPPLPLVLGYNAAGTIEALGPQVFGFQEGDEVYYAGSPIRPGSRDAVDVDPLVERLDIARGKQAGVFIMNGMGGVGAVASQIARKMDWFAREVGGATHTVNHRGDIVEQIQSLKLGVLPIRYVFITHTPDAWVCSMVQDREMPMYGTGFMAKSLTFVWALLGTEPYYVVDVESHEEILRESARLLDECNCMQR